jgi:hypothetical protein
LFCLPNKPRSDLRLLWQVTLMLTRLVALAFILGAPAVCSAQEGQTYAGASVMVSTQDSHRQGSAPSLPTSGAGGTAVGATFEAGRLLTRRLAVGAELSLPSRFTALQETDYIRVFQQESRHRDLVLSGVVREMVVATERVRVDVVEGVGFVQESTIQRRRDQATPLPTFPPVFGPYSDEYSFSRQTFGFLVGGDVEFSLMPHLALVPGLRVHFVRRTDDASEPGWALGLSSVIVRPAIGVRATF